MVRKTLLFLILMLAVTSAATAAGWVNLFDGKTLKGWTVRSGTAAYKVEDGAIVGTAVLGSRNTFLCYEKEFGDFILEFEVKNDPELNSGVQFRSQVAQEGVVARMERDGKVMERKLPVGRVYGYQVEIARANYNSGNVWDEARTGKWFDNFENKPKARAAFKEGTWNKFRVECRGDSIRTWVNGTACADFKDSMTARGIIALQVHGIPNDRFKPYQVRWRNIRIQELK